MHFMQKMHNENHLIITNNFIYRQHKCFGYIHRATYYNVTVISKPSKNKIQGRKEL